VKCTAFGSNGASITELFNITVGDTTAPALALPREQLDEASTDSLTGYSDPRF